jgi:hypothetical protein
MNEYFGVMYEIIQAIYSTGDMGMKIQDLRDDLANMGESVKEAASATPPVLPINPTSPLGPYGDRGVQPIWIDPTKDPSYDPNDPIHGPYWQDWDKAHQKWKKRGDPIPPSLYPYDRRGLQEPEA